MRISFAQRHQVMVSLSLMIQNVNFESHKQYLVLT